MSDKLDATKKRRQFYGKPPDRLDKITDTRTLAMAQRRAKHITQRYPLRVWAAWTSRKFGFWSHVVNGNVNKPGGVRFTQRDLAEINRVFDYITATEKRQTALLSALREAMEALSELERKFDAIAREVSKQ